MSTTREQIADQIRKDCPRFIITDFPGQYADNFGSLKPAQVIVFRDTLTNNGNTLTHNHIIELVTGSVNEADIDGYFDEVLQSLQRIPGVTWKTASRNVFGPEDQPQKYNGWRLSDVTATSSNIYRAQIASEGATQ